MKLFRKLHFIVRFWHTSRVVYTPLLPSTSARYSSNLQWGSWIDRVL